MEFLGVIGYKSIEQQVYLSINTENGLFAKIEEPKIYKNLSTRHF